MPTSNKEKLNPNTINRQMETVNPTGSQVIPRALDAYEPTRPAYVSPDRMAGAGLGNIVRGLGQLEKPLVGLFIRNMDKAIAEGTAEGFNLYTHATDEEKTKLSFKEWSEAHPEQSYKNPYLWKGWEEARLKGLSMDYQKALNDAYTSNGWNNIEDPRELQQKISEFGKQFRQGYLLSKQDNYPNPESIKEFFTVPELAANQQIMDRNSRDIMMAREGKLVNQTKENIFKAVGLLDSQGGNIGLASQQGAGIEGMYNAIAANFEEARKNGVRNDKIPELIAETIFDIYEAKGRNPAVLELLKRDYGGITPIALKNVQAKVNALADQRTDRARADARWGWEQMRQAAWKEEQDNKKMAISAALDSNVSEEQAKEIFKGNPLGLYAWYKNKQSLNSYKKGITGAGLGRSLEQEMAYQDYLNRLKDGTADPSNQGEMLHVAQVLHGNVEEMMKAGRDGMENRDTEKVNVFKIGQSEIMSGFGGGGKNAFEDLAALGATDMELKKRYMEGLYLKEAYRNRFNGLYAELAEKAKKTNTPITKESLVIIKDQAVRETLKDREAIIAKYTTLNHGSASPEAMDRRISLTSNEQFKQKEINQLLQHPEITKIFNESDRKKWDSDISGNLMNARSYADVKDIIKNSALSNNAKDRLVSLLEGEVEDFTSRGSSNYASSFEAGKDYYKPGAKRGRDRGERNCNPGNHKNVKGVYRQFHDDAEGYKFHGDYILRRAPGCTIPKLVSFYVGDEDYNDKVKYTKDLMALTGIKDTKYKLSNNPEELYNVAYAITILESHLGRLYSKSDAIQMMKTGQFPSKNKGGH